MTINAGMHSLAVSFPSRVRTNDWWARKQPELVGGATAKSLAKLWEEPPAGAPGYDFSMAMAPYLKDPFRGAVERRVLGGDETTLWMEAKAARDALAAAGMSAEDVELMIVAAFCPDPPYGVGDAVWLAKELGVRGAAWNMETACSSALVAYQTAAAFVRSGEYRKVLVVCSCTYSRNVDEHDTLSWISADGATAFVVGPVPEGEGVMGTKTVHSAETIGSLYFELQNEPNDGRPVRLRAHRRSGAILRETADMYLEVCAKGAMKAAGVTVKDIDFFAVTTPNAWYPDFCARVLGFEMSKTINMHAKYANIGPVLMPANLYHAAHEGRIKQGDLVLLYTVGSISSCGAMVVRWGDVKLGPPPAPGIPEE